MSVARQSVRYTFRSMVNLQITSSTIGFVLLFCCTFYLPWGNWNIWRKHKQTQKEQELPDRKTLELGIKPVDLWGEWWRKYSTVGLQFLMFAFFCILWQCLNAQFTGLWVDRWNVSAALNWAFNLLRTGFSMFSSNQEYSGGIQLHRIHFGSCYRNSSWLWVNKHIYIQQTGLPNKSEGHLSSCFLNGYTWNQNSSTG